MTAALFYLSAAVLEAYYTIQLRGLTFTGWWTAYQENIAAVVSVWQVEDCGVAPRANLD